MISLKKKTQNLIIGAVLFLTLNTIISCLQKSPTTANIPELKLVSSVKMNVDEPSGLCLSLDAKTLWTVSDRTNRVYKAGFDGKALDTLSYTGIDLEGIAVSSKDSTIWIVEEDSSQLVQLDTLGNELNRVKVIGAGGNSGLEGITINSSNNHFFLLKEQDPGVLIELDESFNLLRYQRINFAFDFSGIFYESQNQHLWIVSDQSEVVYKCDLGGKVLIEYPIDVKKAEGIAVDITNDLVYIVSDSYEELYLFSIKE